MHCGIYEMGLSSNRSRLFNAVQANLASFFICFVWVCFICDHDILIQNVFPIYLLATVTTIVWWAIIFYGIW